MRQEEEWIHEVLGSFDNMRRARMPESLRGRLLDNPPQRARVVMFRQPAVRMMAAGIALLAALNVFAVIAHGERSGDAVAVHTNPVAAEYFTPPPSI